MSGLTLNVLGCGTMGIAILNGILAHLADSPKEDTSIPPARLIDNNNSVFSSPIEVLSSHIPTKFTACVRRPQSKKKIQEALAQYPVRSPTVYLNDNVKAVKEANIILLGCKPQTYREILSEKGMREALEGKFMISIITGVNVEEIKNYLYPANLVPASANPCLIARVMPNTAAYARNSMTVIATSEPALPTHWENLTTWIFSRVGRVVHLPPKQLDACTALCGSGPAFMALILEAMSDGGVAMGIPRAEARLMAAQVMLGTAGLVLAGEHPAILREKVSTPGGCTVVGLLALELGSLRGSIVTAIKETTLKATELGRKETDTAIEGAL